ncbi:hypothetical protein ATANTOWER_031058 [Ataeniobius toweri]|uniref:Uncharacterized protein n=1 Tax=Ataeniobius toweri TaxID=208326 RepID=A0ABU7BV52_9TELE|nr:hypothetical protein [Ataeniobius toweri]
MRYKLFWNFQNKLHLTYFRHSQGKGNSGLPMMSLSVHIKPHFSHKSLSSKTVTTGIGEAPRANVSLLAKTLQTGSKGVLGSRDHMHKLSTKESLFVFRYSFMKRGKLRYKHCLTFSLRPAEANCVPVNSLQRRSLYEAEWSGFPGLKGRQQEPHHCGYGNVQFGGPTEQATPHS